MRSTPAAMPGVFKYRKMQELAKKQGLSNRSLAAAVKVNQGTVTRWAKGEAAPSPKSIARLATLLGVDPSELYVVTETARNLAYYRVLAGYSLAQLAPLVGTSPVHLGRMESGRSSIPPHMRDKLKEYLNLDEERLAKAIRRSQTPRRRPVARPFEFVPAAPPATRQLIGA
ncbi:MULTISPECIES: helix-turn-helix domain-containing protein [Mycolicibacterium]|uniref:Helix-turn-helix transcriptional regulator n=3 Tax=Mycolicibacterium TaxID=1866885 RepID=A0AAE4VJL5_MYCFO|nr:helix-turn-helix transcriptional regulator [Mycolicibacterium fortuitum]MCV7142375.1 helix-turn-helix transcriptional regulator [Mycolicibacterium fortuitum]MDV7194577.1 helix-turn-helix transcriptional regulator [Mycolicibacterium fortuitum]MDV7208139.1 helix-turn-helix transcriptional regulator [Mycolicibacterium fortuitum]MDV7230033.1 helix-turn-helix transcriptional regulator [Mycolicibacterium fortuitum]MDV7261838.1 helix-turn-helix transcriptional regulator [Mycolicibacterium fortuitu